MDVEEAEGVSPLEAVAVISLREVVAAASHQEAEVEVEV